MQNKRKCHCVSFYTPVYITGELRYSTYKKRYYRFKWVAKICEYLWVGYSNLINPRASWDYCAASYHHVHIPKYQINEDLWIDYMDEPPWRFYRLYSSGNTLQELLINATIAEIDQDGDELNCYSIDGSGSGVCSIAEKFILDYYKSKYSERFKEEVLS